MAVFPHLLPLPLAEFPLDSGLAFYTHFPSLSLRLLISEPEQLQGQCLFPLPPMHTSAWAQPHPGC